MTATDDWPELQAAIVAAAKGDVVAQDRIVALCQQQVRALVHRELELDFRKRHRWILPLFSTQDVVHEVLLAVVRDLREAAFAAAPAFHAFLATLVRHRLIDAVRFHEADRRDARRQQGDDGVVDAAGQREATPTLAASLAERAGLVQQALAELPERHRRLLELRLLDGATFPAIAEALGYASAESARQSCLDAQARLLVKLRARGFGRTQIGG
ncbi:MAG: sigma-70 family RNA polymerase sigma factor [Planctomycetes bacterium]|nr:sigma-70 family RNA polymerase sigma factor [Planctomycetota bacterium]